MRTIQVHKLKSGEYENNPFVFLLQTDGQSKQATLSEFSTGYSKFAAMSRIRFIFGPEPQISYHGSYQDQCVFGSGTLFQFDWDPDQTSHYDEDPRIARHQSDSRPLVNRQSTTPFWASNPPLWALTNGPQRPHFWAFAAPEFWLWFESESSFWNWSDSNTHPDPVFRNDADPCRSGSATLIRKLPLKYKKVKFTSKVQSHR